jgi:predicted RNA-binding protein with RPS1 domain
VKSLNREYSFSQDSLILTCDDLIFHLGDTIDVKLLSVDKNNFSLKLALLEDKKESDTDPAKEAINK